MKIIIPIIVGAIIGYFTNWLAIKMLFRPHYEKKIFGIKVPFTPGLIPKEKDRIAMSIGNTVGDYLLTPDTIIEALSNKEIDGAIKSWIYNKIWIMRENQKTITEVLENILGDKYNRLVQEIDKKLKNLIIKYIRKDEFKNSIFTSIAEKINNMDLENIYNSLQDQLREFLSQLPNSHKLKSELRGLINSKLKHLSEDERKVSEILPEEIYSSIYGYIDKNENKIGDNIRIIFKDPIIQDKLKNSISELVYNNLSKVIIAFVSPDIISEKIFHLIEKYINSEDTNKDIAMLIRSLIDRLLESKLSEIIPGVLDTIGEEKLEKISNSLMGYIANEDNFNILINILGEKLRISETENKELIISYLIENIDKILESDKLEGVIDLFIKNIMEELLNTPVSSILEEIDEDNITAFYNSLRIIFDKFIVAQLPKMIEFFNISKIVEEKIQSFDVDFTEKLILDIANKELKAITWLGALLGGMMGLLTPLLQMLY